MIHCVDLPFSRFPYKKTYAGNVTARQRIASAISSEYYVQVLIDTSSIDHSLLVNSIFAYLKFVLGGDVVGIMQNTGTNKIIGVHVIQR